MAKKTETIGFEEQVDESQSAPEFGSHEGAEFEPEVILEDGSSAEFESGVGASGEGNEFESGVGASGEGDEFESEVIPGVDSPAEEDVYTVVDNFWWNNKNRLKGTQIVLTPEEYNQLSEHVYLGE